MEGDQTRLVKTGAQVAAGEHECNGDPAPPTPVEHKPLPYLEDRAGDPAQTPYAAPLKRVHARIVQT